MANGMASVGSKADGMASVGSKANGRASVGSMANGMASANDSQPNSLYCPRIDICTPGPMVGSGSSEL